MLSSSISSAYHPALVRDCKCDFFRHKVVLTHWQFRFPSLLIIDDLLILKGDLYRVKRTETRRIVIDFTRGIFTITKNDSTRQKPFVEGETARAKREGECTTSWVSREEGVGKYVLTLLQL